MPPIKLQHRISSCLGYNTCGACLYYTDNFDSAHRVQDGWLFSVEEFDRQQNLIDEAVRICPNEALIICVGNFED